MRKEFSLFCFAAESVHFALLIPLTGNWSGGSRILGAAALAVEQVNADMALLAGRTLEYTSHDSGCSAKQGLMAMSKLLGGNRRIDAVIGPSCDKACKATSILSGGQMIPQISFSCPLFLSFLETLPCKL